MKPKDVFIAKTPNEVEIKAVVIHTFYNVGDPFTKVYLCYSQNRLFTYEDHFGHERYGKTIVEYCVLPEYDALLS